MVPLAVLVPVLVLADAALSFGPGPDPCTASLDAFCNKVTECPKIQGKGGCGHGQLFYAARSGGKHSAWPPTN